MYEIVILNSAVKQLKKLDKSVKNKIIDAMEVIVQNPFDGERLKGDLLELYSYHLNIASVEYRIAYQIKEAEIVVVIMQIGTRENFYNELKKRIK